MRLALALLVALAAPASAEERDDDEIVPDRRARRAAAEANLEPARKREGFAFGATLLSGLQVGTLDEIYGSGGGLDLRVGTSATDRLTYFVDLVNLDIPRKDDASAIAHNLTLALTAGAQVFLFETLWVRGGVGFGRILVASDPMPHPRHRGLMALTGGGMDLLRRGRFALSGEVTFVSGVYRRGVSSSFLFGIGLTWY